ncbi:MULTISPECIES: hypothetical protein [Cysteiniphilum]|uniref:hypothetical protein n=1 Tax=Cysteiniphilum TaxID=2056696 RepID=UPI00177C8E0D|nr:MULTISPECIES: hypothetical protein [Cysteiniphilum]
MKSNLKHLSSLFALALIGCGGGGSSGGDSPAPSPVKAQLKAQEAIKAPKVIQSGKTSVLSYTVTNPSVEQMKLGAIGKATSNTAVAIKGFETPETDGVKLTYDLSLPQNTCFDDKGQGQLLQAGDQCNIAFLAKLDDQVDHETDKHLTLSVKTSDNAEDLNIQKVLKFVPQNDSRLIDLSQSTKTSDYLKPGSKVTIDVHNNSSVTINALDIQLPQWLKDIALNLSSQQIDELHSGEDFSVAFDLAVDQKTIDTLKAHQDDTIDIIIEAANAKENHMIDMKVSTSIVKSNDVTFESPATQTITYTNDTDVDLQMGVFTLENIADNSVMVENNNCQQTLAAHASCDITLKARDNAHVDDYAKPAYMTLHYATDSGVELSAQNMITIDPVNVAIEEDVQAKQGESFEINVTNNGPFSAYLPEMSYFTMTQQNQNVAGLTIDPASGCFNTTLVAGDSCQVKINTTEDVMPGGYTLHIDQANNMASAVSESFYIKSLDVSLIVEADEGSSQSNMGAVKLTNNGEVKIDNIELDRSALPENVILYNGVNGNSSYGTTWCTAELCPNYCEVNDGTINLAKGKSCSLYMYSSSDVDVNQSKLTVNALGQTYDFNLAKHKALYVEMPDMSKYYALYHMDNNGVNSDNIKKYLRSGQIDQLYWLANDTDHNILAAITEDGAPWARQKHFELLKNVSGTWVNLNFPDNKYNYLGVRAIASNQGDIHVFVSDKSFSKLIMLVGKLEDSTYAWHEVFSIDEAVESIDDINAWLDQYNNHYMVDHKNNAFTKIDALGGMAPLYLSETPLEQSFYFKHDDYLAVIDTEKMDSSQGRISLVNYQTQPAEYEGDQIINHPAASYLFPNYYKTIESVQVIPDSMSFYVLVDAGHMHKTLAQCDIDYDYGHFGDEMHCHELTDIPATAVTANELKVIDNSVWLIGEKIKKGSSHDNQLSLFEYVDSQWQEHNYSSPSFTKGYQITQLGYQYTYPVVQ